MVGGVKVNATRRGLVPLGMGAPKFLIKILLTTESLSRVNNSVSKK